MSITEESHSQNPIYISKSINPSLNHYENTRLTYARVELSTWWSGFAISILCSMYRVPYSSKSNAMTSRFYIISFGGNEGPDRSQCLIGRKLMRGRGGGCRFYIWGGGISSPQILPFALKSPTDAGAVIHEIHHIRSFSHAPGSTQGW